VGSVDDDLLRYYGELFLGAEEEALGRFDAAFDAYQWPRSCPRPRSRHGSRSATWGAGAAIGPEALRALQHLFDLPSTAVTSMIRCGPTTSHRQETSTRCSKRCGGPSWRSASREEAALADRAAVHGAARAGVTGAAQDPVFSAKVEVVSRRCPRDRAGEWPGCPRARAIRLRGLRQRRAAAGGFS
jgi:hypothetical protein